MTAQLRIPRLEACENCKSTGAAPGTQPETCNTCNGTGSIVPGADDTDLPVDGAECTTDVCTAGVPSNPPTASGTACTMGGTVCSGSGACVECLTASTCPGQDTDCKARTCTAGVCGFGNAADGTVTSTQTAGDCLENQCDGNGFSKFVFKNTDVPADDFEPS